MRIYATTMLMLALMGTAPAISAGQAPQSNGIQLAQGDVDVDTRSPRRQPGQRPQRFFCVVQPPASAKSNYDYSCPASPGRVGGKCRCSGMVGTGTLFAR